MRVISKKDARRLGLKHYFTGIPCMRGHLNKRYVSTGTCLDCATIYTRGAPYELNCYPVSVNVYHVEDAQAVQAYAMALNFDRGMK